MQLMQLCGRVSVVERDSPSPSRCSSVSVKKGEGTYVEACLTPDAGLAFFIGEMPVDKYMGWLDAMSLQLLLGNDLSRNAPAAAAPSSIPLLVPGLPCRRRGAMGFLLFTM